MSPWSELVRLSSEPRRQRIERAPRKVYALRGTGDIQVRVLARLKRGDATARQVSDFLEYPYDSTCAMLSAMARHGLVQITGETRGPTKQHARVYGVRGG